MTKDELSSKVGLPNTEQKKPLLMQLLEGFISNEKPIGGKDQLAGVKDDLDYGAQLQQKSNQMDKIEKIEPLM